MTLSSPSHCSLLLSAGHNSLEAICCRRKVKGSSARFLTQTLFDTDVKPAGTFSTEFNRQTPLSSFRTSSSPQSDSSSHRLFSFLLTTFLDRHSPSDSQAPQVHVALYSTNTSLVSFPLQACHRPE
ncbi:hypothetical protein M3J09_001115 [Ascochyta lentis]